MQSSADEPVSPNNGFILNNVFIPEEILVIILSHVHRKTLNKHCTLVCKVWHRVIQDEVWKLKAERDFSNRFTNIKKYKRFPYTVYRSICMIDCFNTNLLKNPTGKDGLKHWRQTVETTEHGGNGWAVESPPEGILREYQKSSDPTHCFVTSYMTNTKNQLINLHKMGLIREILDEYQPRIIISECYAGRWDCSSKYGLEVKLLNADKTMIKDYNFSTTIRNGENGWRETQFSFADYGPGVKYVLFEHTGVDTQFWAGHYGSKMANASVIVDLNSIKDLNE